MMPISYKRRFNCGYFLDKWVLIFLVFSLLKLIPMFLLPKLEYQTYYGVEALTESEVCQLWTESMLHSECLFYIGKFMH